MEIEKINREYLDRMKEMLGKEFPRYLSALDSSKTRGLVLNSAKINRDAFLRETEMKLTPLEFNEDCFLVEGDEKVGGDLLHRAGAFYMQEPSAMVGGAIVDIKGDEIVLDVCASPGGKTFQIAKRLNSGVVIANEIDFERCKILISNVERLGLKNVIVTNFSPDKLYKNFNQIFDLIVVDAPCSGEGMLRKEDWAAKIWSKEYVKECQVRQKEILSNVIPLLKENGKLLYSTCTFSIDEDEEIVEFLLNSGFRLLPMKKVEGEAHGENINGLDMSACKRFYPHKFNGEGQFVSLLQKEDDNFVQHRRLKAVDELKTSEKALFIKFLKDNLKEDCINFIMENSCVRAGTIYFCPNKHIIFDDKNVLSFGVKLGNIEKNRFEPVHNFWTAFGLCFKRIVEIEKPDVDRYFSGNTLNSNEDNGWCSVAYHNLPLGGGKIVDGVVKNHYPKGLRNR